MAFALIVGGVFVALTQLSGSKSNHASTVNVPAGPGVIYRSSDGHFAARFPDNPNVHTVPGSLGGLTYTIIVASDQASGTVVESAKISQALRGSELPVNLTAAVRSTAVAAGTTLTSDSATIFQGSPAHQGEFQVSDGTRVSVIAIGYSTSRIYEVAAPTGAAFDDLLASFVPVP